MRTHELYKKIEKFMENGKKLLPSLGYSHAELNKILEDFISSFYSIRDDNMLLKIPGIQEEMDLMHEFIMRIPKHENIEYICAQINTSACCSELFHDLSIAKEIFIALENNIDCGFDIKLPEAGSLNEFSININQFNKFVKLCPIFDGEDGRVAVYGLQNGSFWIKLMIVSGSLAILNQLANLISKVIELRQKRLANKKEIARIKEIDRDQALANKIIEQYDELERLERLIIARELSGTAEDAEMVTRMHKAVEVLERLMDKGLEVYASLKAPEEVQKNFPSQKLQSLTDKEMELLNGIIGKATAELEDKKEGN